MLLGQRCEISLLKSLFVTHICYSKAVTLSSTPLHQTDFEREAPQCILNRPTLDGGLAKWAVLLQHSDIEYVSQKAIKGQPLADFLAAHLILDGSPLATDLLDEEILLVAPQRGCEIFFDGAYKSPTRARKEDTRDNVARIRILFVSPNKALIP